MKLISSEYVVANVKDLSDDMVELKDPIAVNLVPISEKQVTVMFAPFNNFGHQNAPVNIHTRNILFTVEEPDRELINKYVEATSGISLSSTMPPPPPTGKDGKPNIELIT